MEKQKKQAVSLFGCFLFFFALEHSHYYSQESLFQEANRGLIL